MADWKKNMFKTGLLVLLLASALPAQAAELGPIKVLRDGEVRTLHLKDAGRCAGVHISFLAVRYGLDLLYGDEVPEVTDLLVFTTTPGGPIDLLDKVLRGGGANDRTWPAPDMAADPDNFALMFVRKSTLQMVEVRLQPGLWPADWFALREKNKAGTLTDGERQRFAAHRKLLTEDYPQRSFEELFGRPEVLTFAAWGQLERGEMDRHSRTMRRLHRTAEAR